MKNPYRPVWLVWIVAVLPLAGVFFSPVGVSPAARTWLVGLSAALLALAAAGLQVRKAWTRGRALCCGGLALLVAVSQRKNDDLARTFRTLEDIWDEYGVYEKVDNEL